MKKLLFNLFLITVFSPFFGVLHSKVTLPDILASNAILQQNSSIQIEGTAKANSLIKVKLSWAKRTFYCQSDMNGFWHIHIHTPKASFQSEQIIIDDGTKTISDNILIGEVWFCSGQSNMEMPLKGFDNQSIDEAEEAIKMASPTNGIRMFKVKRNAQNTPEKYAPGKWQLATTQNITEFSALAYFFALELREKLDVPIGIINSSWGGSAIECWLPEEINKKYTDYTPDPTLPNKEIWDRPSVLYNGMISPFVKFKIKGMIWYQGETNVGRYASYESKLRDLIACCRSDWNDSDLPFYIVEIAPLQYKEKVEPAKLREAQLKVASSVKNCGIVCTNDLVKPHEQNTSHPSNKKTIAHRLASLVINQSYLIDNKCVKSPQFNKMINNKDTSITIQLKGFSGEIVPQNVLFGFEIASIDSVFHPAEAILASEKHSLIIYSKQVLKPIAVRYCFKNYQIGNVKNTCGLPLFPFRTDDWNDR